MKRDEMGMFLHKKLGVPKSKAADALDAMFEHMADRLANRGKVVISRFGSLELRVTKDRVFRHPKTGEQVVKKIHKKVRFKPRKYITDRIQS
jgi:nucleoid DNA-binding protein